MNRLFQSVFGCAAKGTSGTVPEPQVSATAHVPVSPLAKITEEDIERMMALPREQRLAEFAKLEAEFRFQVATQRSQLEIARKELAAAFKTLDASERSFKAFAREVRKQS